MKIRNFKEAKETLAEIQQLASAVHEFLDYAGQAISIVESLQQTATPARNGSGLGSTRGIPVSSGVPESWTDRTLKIFKNANAPLKQREVVETYLGLGWPQPENRSELYSSISSAISYLHKKKGLLEKIDEGYRLK